jgi:hypothetical protein
MEWVAGYSVVGLSEECTGRAFGVDGLQALLLAAQSLRIRMAKLRLNFTWLGGEPRATGIDPTIPSFGLAFEKRAQAAVEAELAKYARSRRKPAKREAPTPSAVRTAKGKRKIKRRTRK